VKKVLVMGVGGQLGNCLLRRFAMDTDVFWVGYTKQELDICDSLKIQEVLLHERPDVVINAAAYTDVDKAEGEREKTWEVNAVAPGYVARVCSELNIDLIHISTDYVFNGEDGGTEEKPYLESDQVNPIGVYGESKAEGERAVVKAMKQGGGRYHIVRASWLYDNVGSNFYTKMVKLGQERSEINVVYDQRGTPTYAGSLSEALRALVLKGDEVNSGILHYSDEGVTCWASFARAIFEELEMDVDVLGITTEEYPTPANRPANSHLGGEHLNKILNLEKRTWKESLKMCVGSELERVKKRAEVWSREPYDKETREIVGMWLSENEENLLIEAFHKDIEFGTGGMRGICGPGTNRINAAVIAGATQGLVNYIKRTEHHSSSPLKVAIAYDCRHKSYEFAEVTARVLAGNGIEALLYPELRSTPQLSWTVRHLGCVAGVVITASHNPPEYNGYKVYWADGGQIVSPHDSAIITEVRKIKSLSEVKSSSIDIESEILITLLGPELDEGYIDAIMKLRRSNSLAESGSKACLVFTGLHGAGSVSVPPALRAFGFSNVHEVESQSSPDGNFPTVSSPNPEEGQALAEAILLGKKLGAALVMGTDPDADRVGLAVPNGEGSFQLLNGNETGALLFDYVLSCGRDNGEPYDFSDFVASTIVTSPLLSIIGEGYGVDVKTTLTGFKHIAAAIAEENSMENGQNFIVGAEESYGYLIKDTARDKDAVAACCVLSELAHSLEQNGSTMLLQLEDIHRKYGLFQEGLVSIVKKGREGAEEISDMISGFRLSTPSMIAGEKVVALLDFETQKNHNLLTSEVKNIDLPISNVLQFITEKGSRVTVRPSGTEPKIKFYVSVNTTLLENDDYSAKKAELKSRVQDIFKALGVA
jgi:phosphoglucomutase